MRNLKVTFQFSFFVILFLMVLSINTNSVYGQLIEPEVEETVDPKTPLSEGYRNAIGFDVYLNNFGVGIGGHYGHVVAPYTTLTFRTGITGIRDASEQTFQSFFTGRQEIPNKYKRAFGFPFLLGVKQRFFAKQIEDSFRFYVSAGAGPSLAFTYPYLRDNSPHNGYRDFQVRNGFLIPQEGVNDFFSGWSNGETRWGLSGELKVGVELGSSFSSQTTVEFGYFFYYFDPGLQIMEPRRPVRDPQTGQVTDVVPFNDAQKHFGTPQIKFTFGGMW